MKHRLSKTTRALSLFVVLIAAWLLWSGLFKPLLLALGVFSCVLTVYIADRMGYFDDELFALRIGRRLLGYWAWLSKEVVRSSLDVARIVIDPRLPISPKIITIRAATDHPVDQVILANSITLTPGTVALDVHRGVITVHALTSDGADELTAGEMNRRVGALRNG